MNLDLFLNDNYKILKCLYNNETTIQGKKVIRLSQGDIANELNLSKGKVNQVLNNFIDKGYIKMAGKGRYVLYKKGKDIYEYLAQICESKQKNN